ncbi:hypothetical protein L596_028354 [Steinernema carpocapsae]|uniref:Uncharacterized protein n=1 Tax=Steinernema carpocapsae TaxID=34508 RepID=A0A4U5LY99_STECR|nr:hypothetical protein L596_028354 [Steinernema carpocapsae]
MKHKPFEPIPDQEYFAVAGGAEDPLVKKSKRKTVEYEPLASKINISPPPYCVGSEDLALVMPVGPCSVVAEATVPPVLPMESEVDVTIMRRRTKKDKGRKRVDFPLDSLKLDVSSSESRSKRRLKEKFLSKKRKENRSRGNSSDSLKRAQKSKNSSTTSASVRSRPIEARRQKSEIFKTPPLGFPEYEIIACPTPQNTPEALEFPCPKPLPPLPQTPHLKVPDQITQRAPSPTDNELKRIRKAQMWEIAALESQQQRRESPLRRRQKICAWITIGVVLTVGFTLNFVSRNCGTKIKPR